MRRALVVIVGASLGVVAAIACGAFDGGGGTPAAPGDEVTNAPEASADAGVDAPAIDAGTDAGGPVEAGPDGDGVLVNKLFFIGAREITNAQYDAFILDLLKTDAGPLALQCAWKTSIGRLATCVPPTMAPGAPVTCIDWCEAYRYCTFYGRRLCGKINGGPTDLALILSSANSQWTHACGGVGGAPYPYGPDASASACNTVEYEAGAPVAAGSIPTCQGSVPGLFDMSGNVGEWEDACEPAGSKPEDVQCKFRGGSYADNAATAKCTYVGSAQRKQASPGIGFRCCSEP